MTGSEEAGNTVIRSKNGAVRSKANWTVQKAQTDGHAALRMTEAGKGLYSGFNGEVRWSIEAWWSIGDALRPLRFEKTVTDSSGKVLAQEFKQFNWTAKQVRFERRDLKTGKTTTKVISVPGDTLTVEGIAAALRALPFEDSRPFAAHFLTNEPKLYSITVEGRGREKIRTPNGIVESYKVELVPHLGGVIGAFSFLLPKTYLWYSVDPPHNWIRYQGPESGPGSPEIVIEKAAA
jgi:hypothetical protein